MATVPSESSDKARRAVRARDRRDHEAAIPNQPSVLRTESSLADWMMCALFAAGIIVLMFHAWEDGDIALTSQILGVLLLVSAGALAWLFGFRFAPPSPVELCLAAMGLLSLFRLTLNDDIGPETFRMSFGVSIILLLAVAGNAALIRRIPMERLLNVSATALALATVPILVLEYEGIVQALTAGNDRWMWLLRPLGLHHSLAAIIFSLGIMLSVYRIVIGEWWIKPIFSGALVIQTAIVLATSGRTGVVACAASLTLVFVMRMRHTPSIVWLGVIATAAGSLWFFDQVLAYLANVLQLDSDARGWDSGATGRTELWSLGIELIFADPVRLLFGSGFRTAGAEEIGFETENSYITIVLELGGILGLWFVIALLATVVRLHFHATSPDKDTRLILYGLLPIMQFALIVGIFNRQMLAVGNPASMIFLVVFAGAWVYISEPRRVARAAAAPVELTPEPGAVRRRKKAAEEVAGRKSQALPSSRAMLRRLRARGAADLA